MQMIQYACALETLNSQLIMLHGCADVVGVVLSVGPLTTVNRKSNNEEIPKRDVVLLDQRYMAEVELNILVLDLAIHSVKPFVGFRVTSLMSLLHTLMQSADGGADSLE